MNAKQNLSNIKTWLQGGFIILFGIVFYIAYGCLIWLLVLFQFVTKLLTGKPNSQLLEITPKITNYAHDILRYVTFQTDLRPWPLTQGSNEGTDANGDDEAALEGEVVNDTPEADSSDNEKS
ncbi:MAG: DUF4389 domain-containing protein [Gammaproteobacteria bacterium]